MSKDKQTREFQIPCWFHHPGSLEQNQADQNTQIWLQFGQTKVQLSL